MPGSVNINIPPRLIESARAAQYANREALDGRALSNKIKAKAKARRTAVASVQELVTRTSGELPDFKKPDYWRIWRRRRRSNGGLVLNKLDPYGLNAWETDGIIAGILCEWSTEGNDFTVSFQHDLLFMEERPPVNQSSAPYDTKAFTAASLKDGVYTFAMVSMETVAKTDTTLSGARSFQKFKKVMSHATYPEGGQADQEFLEIMLGTAALSETNSLNPVLNTTATYYDFPASQDWIPFGQVTEQQPGPKPSYWPVGTYNPTGWNAFFVTYFGSHGPGGASSTPNAPATFGGYVYGFGDARITVEESIRIREPVILLFNTTLQARPYVPNTGFSTLQETFIQTYNYRPATSYTTTVRPVDGPGIPYPTWEEYSGPRTPKYPSARFENLFAYENYVANTAYFGLPYPQDPIDGIFNQE